jgi:charged multivesicular body protein 4A/B
MDLANEISTAISNPLGIDSSIDEDELEAELERFEQEALDATLLETTKVPIISTANPQATAVKSTSSLSNLAKSSSQPILNDEDAELEELRASMAL